VLVGYNTGRDRAEALCADIGHARPVHLPLADTAGLDAGLASAADEPVAAVALCAAPPPPVLSFLKTGPDQFRAQFEAAVVGNHRILAGAWRQWLKPRSGGHVLAVLTAALGPPAAPHMCAYITAKSALLGLLEAAVAELGRAGLRVTAASPGYTETAMLAAFNPLLLERARATHPGGRFPSADTVAAFLMDQLRAPPEPGTLRHVRVPDTVTE